MRSVRYLLKVHTDKFSLRKASRRKEGHTQTLLFLFRLNKNR